VPDETTSKTLHSFSLYLPFIQQHLKIQGEIELNRNKDTLSAWRLVLIFGIASLIKG
jgi:hypothetical protein